MGMARAEAGEKVRVRVKAAEPLLRAGTARWSVCPHALSM